MLLSYHFFATTQRGKGEGAEGVPSLVKGDAVGHEARPYAKNGWKLNIEI